MEPLRSFDDLTIGQELTFGEVVLTREAILDFGHKWDPQYFHTDEEAAKQSVYGGLIASGLHTQCACFQAIMRTGFYERTSIGGVGMDVRWLAPVFPDDHIRVTGKVQELIPSRSRTDRGVVKTLYTGTRAQDGQVVIDMLITHFLRR